MRQKAHIFNEIDTQRDVYFLPPQPQRQWLLEPASMGGRRLISEAALSASVNSRRSTAVTFPHGCPGSNPTIVVTAQVTRQ